MAKFLKTEQEASANPDPAAVLKRLLLTGCRRGEILYLRWERADFDHQRLRRPDSMIAIMARFALARQRV